MIKIRGFIHVSYSKNRDWKPFIFQMLTNVQKIFLVMWMLTVPTPLDHIYVHATLDTPEMDRLAQVILMSFLQSQPFKAESSLKRPFNSNYDARSSQTFILKCSSARGNSESMVMLFNKWTLQRGTMLFSSLTSTVTSLFHCIILVYNLAPFYWRN